MKLEDIYEIGNLKIEKVSEPIDIIRIVKSDYTSKNLKNLYNLLYEDNKIEYDSWCRHSD